MKKLSVAIIITMMASSAFAETVATVNGKNISREEFEEYHLQNLKFVGQRKITKQVSIQDLVNRELGIQKARKTGTDKDPIVVRKQEDILFNAQTSRDLEGEFKKIEVTDADVKKYYDENKEYRTAHILFRLKAEPTPDEVKKAYEQSWELTKVLRKSPDDFAKMAAQYSQTTGAQQAGGDLGFQPPTRLAPEYFEAIKGQKVGFITEPIRTQMGYHVIKVLGVKSIDQIDKNLYKKIIYDRKRDALIENYFKGLSKGADIKINENL